MNLSISQFIPISEPLATTVSSPKRDLISLAWDHIAARYLSRLASNRVLAGRVRSIRSLAVHDAIHSVVDPGNGHIYREMSAGTTTEAASAAAVQSSHDILAAVFTRPEDQADLADLLAESLGLIGNESEKSAGILSGNESAAAYLSTFATLLVAHHQLLGKAPFRQSEFSPTSAIRFWPDEWQRSA